MMLNGIDGDYHIKKETNMNIEQIIEELETEVNKGLEYFEEFADVDEIAYFEGRRSMLWDIKNMIRKKE
jgi:hypothetical protein